MLLLVSLAILPLYLHGEKCTQVNFLGGIRRPVLIMLDHCSLAQLFQVFCRTPNSAGDDYRISSFFGLYFYVIRFVCRIKSLTILPNAIRPKEDGELLFLKKMETALWKAKYLCGKRGVVSRIQL